MLPDFPATSSWLSPLERRLAEKRLEEDVGSIDKDQKESGNHFEGLVMAFSDWKVWWLALALTSMVISLSFNAFFPTLSKTMGFDTTVTLLLCAPPWVFATICAFLVTRQVSVSAQNHGVYDSQTLQALRCNWRTILSYCLPTFDRNSRVRDCHEHHEHCGPIHLAVSLRRIIKILLNRLY